jgi:hypothetical protein
MKCVVSEKQMNFKEQAGELSSREWMRTRLKLLNYEMRRRLLVNDDKQINVCWVIQNMFG